MHLIRNSVDHGIESNEDRKALGKKKKEKLFLKPKMKAVRSGFRFQITVKVLKRVKFLRRQKQTDFLEINPKKI